MNSYSGLDIIKKFIIVILLCSSLHETHGSRIKRTRKIKVCVIGAGAAGISATRHLAGNLDSFEVSVFEKASEVGGTWVYTNKTGVDDYGYPVSSSMYKHLRSNVPKELMNFPDWPEYKGVNTSCVPHQVVKEYLQNYTDHFELRPFIQFNTIVEKVTLFKKGSLDKWKVTVKNLESFKTSELVFDAVIVCNGHYFKPRIPQIPGLENFSGQVLHSHNYRWPENFKNKTVLILGAGSSGVDIGLEIKLVTPKVYLSHNYDYIPVSLYQVAGIDRFENGKFILKDNSSMVADVLLLCTGYHYHYSFLDDSAGVTVDDNFVSPLYQHIFNAQHPSMSFVGISTGIIPFPMFHQQAQYVVSFLKGRTKLPSLPVLMEDSKLKRPKKKNAHVLFNGWNYTNYLAFLGGFEFLPDYYKVAHAAWLDHWVNHYDDFKDYNLVFEDDHKVVKIVKPEKAFETDKLKL